MTTMDFINPETEEQKLKRLPKTQQAIIKECDALKEFLLDKNRKYGDSAVHPVRVFSSAHPVTQIDVRLDDKLSRIESGQTDDTEDIYLDIMGYIILRRIAVSVHGDPNAN